MSSAISALFVPAAAANTILARSTVRAWAVPLRVRASNRPRSSSLNSITKGLRRDNSTPKVLATRHHAPHHPTTYTYVVTPSTTKEARSPEHLMTPPALYRTYKGVPVRYPANPSSVDHLRRAVPPASVTPVWKLVGAQWTPWSTATGTYTYDWSETPEGVALTASDPRRHWSYEAWDTFARYQDEAARYLVESVACAKQTIEIVASMTSPGYYTTQFQKPTFDLDDPRLCPKTGLAHEYVYNNEQSLDGEKLGPNDPRRHWSPVAFVEYEVYGLLKAFYNERLAIHNKNMQAESERFRRATYRFWWRFWIALVAVAAVEFTVLVLILNWVTSQTQGEAVGAVSRASTFLASGPHLWRG